MPRWFTGDKHSNVVRGNGSRSITLVRARQMLPAEVQTGTAGAVCDWHGPVRRSWKSVTVVKSLSVAEAAEQDFAICSISLNYKVLFCHGGGRGQFAGVPLNLLAIKPPLTMSSMPGYWAARD